MLYQYLKVNEKVYQVKSETKNYYLLTPYKHNGYDIRVSKKSLKVIGRDSYAFPLKNPDKYLEDLKNLYDKEYLEMQERKRIKFQTLNEYNKEFCPIPVNGFDNLYQCVVYDLNKNPYFVLFYAKNIVAEVIDSNMNIVKIDLIHIKTVSYSNQTNQFECHYDIEVENIKEGILKLFTNK